MPVASRDFRSVHGTLLPNASCCSGLLDALINYILNFAINFVMSCMKKNTSLAMDISHEHRALWRFMVTEQGRCLCVVLPWKRILGISWSVQGAMVSDLSWRNLVL